MYVNVYWMLLLRGQLRKSWTEWDMSVHVKGSINILLPMHSQTMYRSRYGPYQPQITGLLSLYHRPRHSTHSTPQGNALGSCMIKRYIAEMTSRTRVEGASEQISWPGGPSGRSRSVVLSHEVLVIYSCGSTYMMALKDAKFMRSLGLFRKPS